MGVYVFGSGGTGPLSYTDTNASPLTTGAGWALYLNSNAGAVTVDTNGALSGTSNPAQGFVGKGLSVVTNGFGAGITTRGTVTATGATSVGIDVGVTGSSSATASGDTRVTTFGTVTATGASSEGIRVLTYANAANVVITTNAAVSGDLYGIDANVHTSGNQQGFGNTTITTNASVTATGAATPTSSPAVGLAVGDWNSLNTGTLTVTTNGSVTGRDTGLSAHTFQKGLTTITAVGDIVATANTSDGLYFSNQPTTTSPSGYGNAIISVNNVRGGQSGILSINAGATSTVSTTISGAVTGTGTGQSVGVVAVGLNNGAGLNSINIQPGATVQGGSAALYLLASANNTFPLSGNTGTSSFAVVNAGTIQNSSGLSTALAIYGNGGTASIQSSGLITGTVQLSNGGINSVTNTGTWNTANGTNWFDGSAVSGGRGVVDNQGLIIAAAAGATSPVVTTFNGIGLNSFTNSGTLQMQNGVVGDQTVITGHYAGSGNGLITFDTYFGTDYAPSDRLILNGGSATGRTLLGFNNVGGPGALTLTNGILVVSAINGATSAPGAFYIPRAIPVGAFDYNLYRGGPGAAQAGETVGESWYLRSMMRPVNPTNPSTPENPGTPETPQNPQQPGKPLLSPQAQIALPYVDILGNFADATLGTLQQRTGNRIWSEESQPVPPAPIWCKDPARNYRCTPTPEQNAVYAGTNTGTPVLHTQGVWGRIVGQFASYDPRVGASYSQNIGFLQAGYERVIHEAPGGRLTWGSYVVAGTSYARITVTPDPVAGVARQSGRITTTGYGVGMNLTWLGYNGFYADAVGQFTRYDSALSIKNGNNQGWSSVASLEVGRRFNVGSGWGLVPQAQLAWTHVDFTSFADNLGNWTRLGRGDSLMGRAGMRVENQTISGDRRLQFYGIVNLRYQFLSGTSVNVSGISLVQQERPLWGEIGAGVTYAWNKNWLVHGEASYATALSHGGASNYSARATAGLRYTW